MEVCLLTHYYCNRELKSCVDFDGELFQNQTCIYEVIRVINSKPLFLNEHLERFSSSLALSSISSNLSINQIKYNLKQLIEVNNLRDGNIKFILISFPNGKNDFYCWVSPHKYPTEFLYENGVNCSLMMASRNQPNAKTINSKLIKKASLTIKNTDTFEVILFNEFNIISEGSKSNLFFVLDNKIYTSTDDQVLMGISRAKVIEICDYLKIELVRKLINIDEMGKFTAAFLSGTSIKVLPIKSIESTKYDSTNDMLSIISNEFDKQINNNLSAFEWNL